MTPPIWTDIAADLDAATGQTNRAVARNAALAGRLADDREAHELAIGKHLHDAYCAVERALERLLEMVDDSLPSGRHYHHDVIARARRAVEDVRPPIISAETAADLQEFLKFRHAFRHIYGVFEYSRAAPNVDLAARVIPRARHEITAFAVSLGLAPRA